MSRGHLSLGPTVAFRAPGRINIIGEHTDYNLGLVMPAAIDRWCTVRARTNGARRLRVRSSAFAGAVDLDLDALTNTGTWSAYVAGVAFVLARAGVALVGADLEIDSDVPVGAGISSSAALEVATVRALLALAGETADGTQVAHWAREAENDFVGIPCGIMDQFASANGVAGAAMMLDCRTLEATPVPVPTSARFLVVNSMQPHVHAGGEYAARRADCEAAARLLGIQTLRDLDEADLPRALPRLPQGLGRRARHVVTENARVRLAATAMSAGDLRALGGLINASHASLRDDMRVSLPMIDALAEIAQATAGVYGARVMGGGFGGCV
ncbi:MAG: galactokinase, partial [Caulobacteraceae bacterium]|nr:galactokinase [Caulobacteraceae bacterium]